MGSNYNNDIFKQLQEVLERSDKIENDIKQLKVEHKLELINQEIKFDEECKQLNIRIDNIETELTIAKTENVLLHNDNERTKRIINNDSSNSSLPPSTDQKGKGANTYNLRGRVTRNVVVKKGIWEQL